MKEIQKNSPNHYKGRYGLKPDVLVCHQTGGTSVEDALKWYLNPAAQCSPNDVIDTNGDIYHLGLYPEIAKCLYQLFGYGLLFGLCAGAGGRSAIVKQL